MIWLSLLVCSLGFAQESDLNRGLELFRGGKLDEAEQVFMAAWRRYPSEARFPLELAGVAYRKKDRKTAKARLRSALRLDPDNEYGNEFLALLYQQEGNLEAALRYWNRVKKPLIQEVHFDPEPRLPPRLIERAFAISGGQVFTEERLATTEANLARLNVFTTHKFDLALRQDQRFDATFRSAQRGLSAGGWLGRLLPFARGLPYQAVHFDRFNLGQRALNLESLGRWDVNKRRVFASLTGPVRSDPRLKFRIGMDARDETWDLPDLNGLVLRKVEAGGELEYGLSSRLSWTSGLWITKRGFHNEDQSQTFISSWSFLLRNVFSYTLLSIPERRLRVDGLANLRTGRVVTGVPSRLIKAEAGVAAKWLPQPTGDDLQVDLRAGAGKIIGKSPFDELFILGMERDNDLWLRGHSGTRNGRKGSAPLGQSYLLVQSSIDRTVLKFPFVRFQLGPFFDAGRTGDPSRRFGSRGWVYDAGVQSKIKVLGGLTWTIVYGRNLRDGGGVFYTAVSR